MLLGWILRHHSPEGTVSIEITEVEAYEGERDPASHAYRGPTARNSTMFGPAGHLYVYLSYGIHRCCNITTGSAGHGSGVLLRSARIVEGIELVRERRGSSGPDVALARGPGCLGAALGIELEHNGSDLLGLGGGLELVPAERLREFECGPRVGVSRAYERPWRFWLPDERSVSAYRRSPRATSSIAEAC